MFDYLFLAGSLLLTTYWSIGTLELTYDIFGNDVKLCRTNLVIKLNYNQINWTSWRFKIGKKESRTFDIAILITYIRIDFLEGQFYTAIISARIRSKNLQKHLQSAVCHSNMDIIHIIGLYCKFTTGTQNTLLEACCI